MSDIAQNTQKVFELFESAGNQEKYPQSTILATVKKGVDVNQTNVEGWTLLHWAARYGDLEVCKELLEQGANKDARKDNHETPLHWATWNGDIRVCAFLLKQGADIHARNHQGLTPLHVAIRNMNLEAVKLLLARGANIWAQKNDCKTALDVDELYLLKIYCDELVPKLEKVKDGNCEAINTTEHLYHLASVMQPHNPKDIPHPKEFIRELFARYLPQNEKFNKLFSTIFNNPRGPETLAQSRNAARQEQRGV